jgi:hypothetical protein
MEGKQIKKLSQSEALIQFGDIQGNKEHGESPESKAKKMLSQEFHIFTL